MDNKKYRALLKDIFNTESGRLVLAHLYETYVNSSAIADTESRTYYNLGQKELVQDLLRDASAAPDAHIKKLIDGAFNDNFNF